MGTLDRVIEMQQRGMSDIDISRQLQNQGISPREINDSLNQAKIKSAVSQPQFTGQSQEIPQQSERQMSQGMQQSIMQPSQEQTQIPQQAMQQEYPQEQVQPEYQGYYPETPQAYGGGYGEQAYYPQTAGLDTDTISEIAEQVVQEKFANFEKKTGDIVAFKSEVHDKISDLNERLKKIENSIDKLQQAVIGKIGEFGETNQAIHKDLEALHNTTSKLMNPLIDNYKELRRIAERK